MSSAAGLAAVMILGLAGGSSVAAGQPTGVTIVSPMAFNQEGGFNHGTFTASGPAVDQGLICESGEVDDTRLLFIGWQSDRGAQIPVWKTFTCENGDAFFVRIQVHLDFATSTETFSWVIQGGTGDLAGIRGSGSGTTVSDGSDPQTGNINTYTGFVLP
jgi:hypothetical protein